MDYLAPPTYDVSNIDMWKFKMSAYLKALVCMFILAQLKSLILVMARI